LLIELKIMQLDKNKFSLAAAATIGVLYIICAILVALAPNAALNLLGWLVHLVNLQAGISFPGAIYGFAEAVVLSYLAAYVFAWLHNRFMKQ